MLRTFTIFTALTLAASPAAMAQNAATAEPDTTTSGDTTLQTTPRTPAPVPDAQTVQRGWNQDPDAQAPGAPEETDDPMPPVPPVDPTAPTLPDLATETPPPS